MWQMHSKYLLDESLTLPLSVACICTCFEWFGLNSSLCTLIPLSVSLGRDSHLGLFLVNLHLSALSCGLIHLYHLGIFHHLGRAPPASAP